MKTFWVRMAEVLPLPAVDILRRAAEEARNIADPEARANRIDHAIHVVRNQYPEFFKE